MYGLMLAVAPEGQALGATALNRVAITLVEVLLLLVGGIFVINRTMFRMGVRNVRRRRTQSILVVTGLMLATVIITAASPSDPYRSVTLPRCGVKYTLVAIRSAASPRMNSATPGSSWTMPTPSGRGRFCVLRVRTSTNRTAVRTPSCS